MDTEKRSDETAHFLLELLPDGLWLTVYPSAEGAPGAEVAPILEEARRLGYRNVNSIIVAETIRDAKGVPVKLAEKIEIPEPEVQVIVARDRMEAFLQIH